MKKIVNYDSDNDILYVNKGFKVKDSLQIEDFIIDFSYKNKIVGIEVLNASHSISALLDENISDLLKNLKDAKIVIRPGKNVIFIVLIMFFRSHEKEIKKPISLSVPASISR